MIALASYQMPVSLPSGTPARIAHLLGITSSAGLDEVGLAEKIASGLPPKAADALSGFIGQEHVVGPVIPEATLRRARRERKALSREMSERLYEISRVVDAAGVLFKGDPAAISRFLMSPHPLLGQRPPIDMARSSSAGADAVLNLMRRAEAGFTL